MDRKNDDPLAAEALTRDEWRGEETSLKPEDAPGHTLPERERHSGADNEGGAGRPDPLGRTILPPD